MLSTFGSRRGVVWRCGFDREFDLFVRNFGGVSWARVALRCRSCRAEIGSRGWSRAFRQARAQVRTSRQGGRWRSLMREDRRRS